MAYISHDKLRCSDFYNNVSSKARVQDINLSQLILKVNDTYKKNENITPKFEPHNKKIVVRKAYLDTELSKIKGHLSLGKL